MPRCCSCFFEQDGHLPEETSSGHPGLPEQGRFGASGIQLFVFGHANRWQVTPSASAAAGVPGYECRALQRSTRSDRHTVRPLVALARIQVGNV